MTSLPTGKMIEAVAEAYAAFSKFLAKAVKYYRESKLMSAIKAFGFPWETRFQVLVDRINGAFQRIRELASAGHFGIAVQSQNMLRSISHDQQSLRLEMHQDSVNLRKQLKEELKDEVQSLFDSFDKNWIQRFEQIMQSAIPALEAAGSVAGALPAARSSSLLLPEAPNQATLPSHPKMAAIEYADSIGVEKPPLGKRFCFRGLWTVTSKHHYREYQSDATVCRLLASCCGCLCCCSDLPTLLVLQTKFPEAL
jgi:hypothetical protein